MQLFTSVGHWDAQSQQSLRNPCSVSVEMPTMRLHFMVPEVLIDLWHTDGQAFIMAHAEQRRPRKSWAWHDRGGQSHLLVMCLKGKSASQLFTELNLGAGWGDFPM